jgi:hypothetical protein
MPPPPLGENWKNWGERLNSFITGTRGKLEYITTDDSAAEDGILMWDRSLGTLVVSKNGAWVKVKLDP